MYFRLTRGLHNQLLHYMTYDSFEGVLVSPSPHDLSAVQASPTHKHVLYNFYASSLRIRETFANRLSKTV
ncbi:hypothetical protein DPMN_060616 [Dreissena polymorpha]|uniref:Uncharacterized protein n=1 Tax=Dreissena polymorpha TaxID=45954 RepID=A0A9D4C5X8_DREPO|nr:hypothetical protein DPMN_060616 [Dreissena polymorpha]